MRRLRRSRRDDVHVESFVENLHRIATVATAPIRRVIDLRRDDDPDQQYELDGEAPTAEVLQVDEGARTEG